MTIRCTYNGNYKAARAMYPYVIRKVLPDALMLRKDLNQYRHVAPLPGDGVAEIICNFGHNEINIYMPPKPPVPKQPEELPSAQLLVLLGDEFVGYHFFTWSVESEQMGAIKTADTLEDIYRLFPPALNQDDVYIYRGQAGVPHSDFWRYEGIYFTERLFGDVSWLGNHSDYFTRTYEHPVEGTVTCEARLEQTHDDNISRDSIEYNGPQTFSGIKEHMLSLDQTFFDDSGYTHRYVYRVVDRNTSSYIGKFQPAMLVKNIPLFKGNHYDTDATKIADTMYRDYRISDATGWTDYDPYKIQDIYENAHIWTCPLGNLKLVRRNPHLKEVDASKPWRFSYWDIAMTDKPDDPKEVYITTSVRVDTARDEASRFYTVNVENKLSNGYPDTSNYNTIGNKTFDYRVLRDKGLMFQIYTQSLVEWVGKPASDESTDFEELYKADCTWIAAGCGRITSKDDSAQQERSPAFEEAIAKLIDQAVKDQYQTEKINEHRHYRGYIHGYFYDTAIKDIFAHPRSRDAERLKLLNLVNEARKDNDLDPVKMQWDLEKAAIRFTFDMVDDLHIGHTGQDGSTALQRQDEAHIFTNAEVYTTEMENNDNLPYGGGENTAWSKKPSPAEEIFEVWKNSDPHWNTILDPTWNYGMMGADFREGSDGNIYWAQEFAYNPNY